MRINTRRINTRRINTRRINTRRITAAAPRSPITRHARRWAPLAGLAAVGLVVAACASSSGTGAGSGGSSSTPPPAATGQALAAAHTNLGTILVDANGHTVYEFAADKPGVSNCTGACLQYWPVVSPPSTLPASVTGVDAKVGEITRSDGTKQLTVNGWPVYTYYRDTKAGATGGQGTNIDGGYWWVVAPSGALVKTAAGSSHTSAPSTSKSSGSAWG